MESTEGESATARSSARMAKRAIQRYVSTGILGEENTRDFSRSRGRSGLLAPTRENEIISFRKAKLLVIALE